MGNPGGGENAGRVTTLSVISSSRSSSTKIDVSSSSSSLKSWESLLTQTPVDVYDTAQPENSVPGGDNQDGDGDGTTADDRLAEQFQRQYMDDMAARRRQRKKPAQTTAAAGPAEDVLKGPKLGGSRNARAAVRDALLKKEKEGRK